ncbi:MAG: carbohydrate ABC transporter permease [Clostridia bacterium]|nr:carbohydrate ABC transporter permease [Clostridia bacterium]
MKFRKPQFAMFKKKSTFARRFTRSKIGNFFYCTFLVAGGLFSVLPLIYSVVTSFKPIDELLIFPPRFFVQRPTISNYLALPDLLSNLQVPLSRYIANSLLISIITTFLYIIISSMAAFVLAKGKFKGRKAIFWTIQMALMFNAYTLSIPSYLIYAKLNIIDTYWVYLLPSLADTMGVFLMKQYMEDALPDALLEAAKIDGAGYTRVFWNIVMPTVKPMWLTLMLFGFRGIWSLAPGTTIFTEQLKTLPMVTPQIAAGGTARAGSSMAMTVIMMIPPIIVYMISQSNVMQAMTSAGIKE